MDSHLSRIYYSPGGYWKGIAAIKKLTSAAGAPLDAAKDWLKKQAIWQIYLPAARRIPRPKFDVRAPNEVHQADLLFLPHDRVGRRTYKYALTVVDVASRYKEAEPLTSKGATEVADALSRIYKRGPLKWPKLNLWGQLANSLLSTTSRPGAAGSVATGTKESWSGGTELCLRGSSATSTPRRCGCLLVGDPQSGCSGCLRLSALNGEVTRLTGKRPSEAIRAKSVSGEPSSTVPGRPVGLQEQKLPSGVGVRYLYQPGELEGGRRRATDPVWSLQVYRLGRSVTKPDEPVLYYLDSAGQGPSRGFVREELLVVPPDTQLPPDGVLKR